MKHLSRVKSFKSSKRSIDTMEYPKKHINILMIIFVCHIPVKSFNVFSITEINNSEAIYVKISLLHGTTVFILKYIFCKIK